MKKILGLTVAALLVMALVGGGTWAYFNDVETSSANILSAGTLDLNVDGDNVNVNMLSLSDLQPGDVSGGSPGTCELRNIGNLIGDLTIATSASDEDESTGTTGTADGAGSTITLVDSTLGGSDDDWIGYYLRCTSGDNDGEYFIVTDYVAASGTLTVGTAFTAATASLDTYALHTEYEFDGDPGELGGYVTISIWLDRDNDGATYEITDDLQLLTGGVSDSNAQVYDAIADLDGTTWTDCIALATAAYADLYIEYDFDDSGDQNDAQGDSLTLPFTFTLNQQ